MLPLSSKIILADLILLKSVRAHRQKIRIGVANHDSGVYRHLRHFTNLHLLLEGAEDPRKVQIRADSGE
jgi:hypothetical protein